jgi:hypothetical protein
VRVRRTPVVDELVLDGELVVLVDDTVLVLSEVASTALQRLSTTVWTSLTDLTGHLDEAVGLPANGPAAVSALVSALSEAGLVSIER